MREYTAARYVIATATFCAVAEETAAAAAAAAAATAQWESLLADGHVTAEDIDTTPRLALVDDARDPSSWAFVDEYYRVRHADKRHTDANAYHLGAGVNLFEEREAAIAAARSLDDLGDEWDMCVVAFDDVVGSGRVVWGS